jgi:hypothetical protein
LPAIAGQQQLRGAHGSTERAAKVQQHQGGPDHSNPVWRATMADPNAITILFDMPRNEWSALAQFVKRVDYGAVGRFADRKTTYAGRSEHDVTWSALQMLRRQLAEAGYAPR